MPLTAIDLLRVGASDLTGQASGRGRQFDGVFGQPGDREMSLGSSRRQPSSDSIPSTNESIIYEHRAICKKPVTLQQSPPSTCTPTAATLPSKTFLSQDTLSPWASEDPEDEASSPKDTLSPWASEDNEDESPSPAVVYSSECSFDGDLSPSPAVVYTSECSFDGDMGSPALPNTYQSNYQPQVPSVMSCQVHEFQSGWGNRAAPLQGPIPCRWTLQQQQAATFQQQQERQQQQDQQQQAAGYAARCDNAREAAMAAYQAAGYGAPRGHAPEMVPAAYQASPQGCGGYAYQGYGWHTHLAMPACVSAVPGCSGRPVALATPPPPPAQPPMAAWATSLVAARPSPAAPHHMAGAGVCGSRGGSCGEPASAVLRETLFDRKASFAHPVGRGCAEEARPEHDVGDFDDSHDDAAFAEGAEHLLDEYDDTPKTTVMLVGLPKGLTRDRLVEVLGAKGFTGKFDFAYLPCNFLTGGSNGYAFVNMVSEASALEIKQTLHGSASFGSGGGGGRDGICQVIWAKTQGLDANVERFRNCPVMRGPAECRPMVFRADGTQKRFPRPTKAIKKPKKTKGAREAEAMSR